MGIFASLRRDQKEAIGLLQIGTFLEYFDLMLYVRLAVLLDGLFFPKTDPHTAALISAFVFCSTFVVRPFGALIFGYIGDNIGRKNTVIITTTMMALSCVLMANLPTYAEIGITAAWVVTICRISQGLSSMGEIMGAQIYVAEITKPPVSYPAVAMLSVAATAGSMVALGVAATVTATQISWRAAFWMGALIAVVGSIARTRLRETPTFLNIKSKLNKNKTSDNIKTEKMKLKFINDKRLKFFLIYCGWPLSFYLAYMYFLPQLKLQYKYSSENIIIHNFCLSIIQFSGHLMWTYISQKIHPLVILRWRGSAAASFLFIIPFVLDMGFSLVGIFLIQSIILIFNFGGIPAESILLRNFPVQNRFMSESILYALSRAVMYIFISFGLTSLYNHLGNYALWIISFPIAGAFLWGVHFFEETEIEYTTYTTNKKKMNLKNLQGIKQPLTISIH